MSLFRFVQKELFQITQKFSSTFVNLLLLFIILFFFHLFSFSLALFLAQLLLLFDLLFGMFTSLMLGMDSI